MHRVTRRMPQDVVDAADAGAIASESVPIPQSFKCPITQEVMQDPVVTVDGQVYDIAHDGGQPPRTPRTRPYDVHSQTQTVKRQLDDDNEGSPLTRQQEPFAGTMQK